MFYSPYQLRHTKINIQVVETTITTVVVMVIIKTIKVSTNQTKTTLRRSNAKTLHRWVYLNLLLIYLLKYYNGINKFLNFLNDIGTCKYGNSCTFAHGDTE